VRGRDRRRRDPRDGARAESVSEPGELTANASVTPAGVPLRQTHHEVTDLVTEGWATGPVEVDPLFRDQAAVPGQQRG
jgi:hypothetical protein